MLEAWSIFYCVRLALAASALQRGSLSVVGLSKRLLMGSIGRWLANVYARGEWDSRSSQLGRPSASTTVSPVHVPEEYLIQCQQTVRGQRRRHEACGTACTRRIMNICSDDKHKGIAFLRSYEAVSARIMPQAKARRWLGSALTPSEVTHHGGRSSERLLARLKA
ncbi:uncharacterized protein MYCFIDRAFT_169759 [Pseudocercospora fijiensis CIRAD86]|uniref:Secreted protein n=1 Tax=Pseudocercospora fijiensis (strain CIRAD86) TaxID=383855 RepID=N1QAN8_PSEFD|nr:uncharacterized protein MYCFIDRAFT_169759 [Pseudocercospora fijiensis CIRAD86]EME88057.1 hypothetical protein MYCFIDRAFT_169759 [Pseudocercospora fijiensis CIRAD86]